MKLSIVTTLYHSQYYVERFCVAMAQQAQLLTPDYEIILVNDGSPDASLNTAVRLQQQDAHIRVVDLARNFGEHVARMSGLAQAKGDFIYLIQCDLEVAPESLGQFWQAMRETPDTDLVFGVQEKRRGSLWERITGGIFYTIFNTLSDAKIARNDAGCRLMTRRFADALLQHRERTLFFAGVCAITGFGQKAQTVVKARSNKGSYSFAKRCSMTINAVTSFSIMPLLVIFYMGMGILLLSFLYMAVVVFDKLAYGIPVDGWTSVIVSLWFLGGLIIAAVGVLGIYLSRIFLEVKQRPYSIIKHVYGAE